MPARPDDWLVEVELVEDDGRVPSAGMVAVDGDLVVGDRVGAVLSLQRVEPEQWRDRWTTRVDLLPRLDLTQYQAAIEQVAGFVVVDIATGNDLWTYPLDGGEALVRQDGTVVVTHGESEVTSLGLLDGQVKWTAEVEGLRVDARGLSDGTVVIVMAVQGRSWVLDAFAVATGERLWFADAPGTPDLNELFFAGPPPRLELIDDRPVVRSGNALTWLG